MGEKTGIAWCHHTFGPWWGCEKDSPGCLNCYAETWASRFGFDLWGKTAPRRFFGVKHWEEPLKWDKKAHDDGVKRLVFCGSMCDVFEDRDDLKEQREKLWRLIEVTPNLIWLLLTKRPENISWMLPARWSEFGYHKIHGIVPEKPPFPNNIWMGVTAENQAMLDSRWPLLESVGRYWYIPVLWISAEPLLSGLDISPYAREYTEREDDNVYTIRGIDWLIAGAESGTGARQTDTDDYRSLRNQCKEYGVPFFLKQLMINGLLCKMPELDGQVWAEFPQDRYE